MSSHATQKIHSVSFHINAKTTGLLTFSRQNVLFSGMNIGERLKQLRQARQLTQAQLAEKVGRIQSEIYRWERGVVRIPADDLPSLAKALDVPISAFFDEESENTSSLPIDWELQEAGSHMPEEDRRKLVEFLRTAYVKVG